MIPDVVQIAELRDEYQARRFTPLQVAEAVLARIETCDPAIWITQVPSAVLARAQALTDDFSLVEKLPLYGIPFAVKDNIDVAGLPTTAACPAYAYAPERDAAVVQRLLEAGAMLIGKTNLDQFATGLNGTRSPYGAPRCVFDERYISGGSSSGSAVAVAAGLVAFSLGTDTAGFGRVPAAFNNIVGLKPTKGLLSTTGLCRPVARSTASRCSRRGRETRSTCSGSSKGSMRPIHSRERHHPLVCRSIDFALACSRQRTVILRRYRSCGDLRRGNPPVSHPRWDGGTVRLRAVPGGSFVAVRWRLRRRAAGGDRAIL